MQEKLEQNGISINQDEINNNEYEKLLIKLEADIRNYIKVMINIYLNSIR